MRVGLLAEKVGMTRFYDKDNINHSVTVLKVSNCKVVSIKNADKNGYNALTLCHGNFTKSLGKPFKEFLKKNNLKPFYVSKEFRSTEIDQFKVGDSINASNFVVGQFVDVSSNSIGKGFAGGMKRHNFSGNRATHGVSISHRSHGSTGQCQDPGKVFKGKKMAGRLGNKKVTIQNLKVLNIDIENNLIIIKGAVPGHKGSIIKIVDSIKKNQQISPKNSVTEESKQIENETKSEAQTPATEAPKQTENETKAEAQTPATEAPKQTENETKAGAQTQATEPTENQTKAEVTKTPAEETPKQTEREPKDGD